MTVPSAPITSDSSSRCNSGLALVVGSSGAIGSSLVNVLNQRDNYSHVISLSRSSDYYLDLFSEETIIKSAASIAELGHPIKLVIVASGILHSDTIYPEKSWRKIEAQPLETLFRVNAIGPMLLMKHFLPLLPKRERAVFVCLSARVGSIEDNELGGWYGYRASKAALNQFIKTASIELSRRNPEAICVALHPGTVTSNLSEPFSKGGLSVTSPETCAENLSTVIDQLTVDDTGGFFDYKKRRIVW